MPREPVRKPPLYPRPRPTPQPVTHLLLAQPPGIESDGSGLPTAILLTAVGAAGLFIWFAVSGWWDDRGTHGSREQEIKDTLATVLIVGTVLAALAVVVAVLSAIS